MSDVYFVETAPTGLVVSLAEAKHHLRIDDEIAGAKASITFGVSNAQLVLQAKYEGTYANDFDAVIVESGTNTALSVSFASNIFTINLATDGMGDAVSTVNDVIAALLNQPSIAQQITATSGAGTGIDVLGAESIASFTGGLDGTSFEDDYVTALVRAAQGRAETILRKKILDTVMVKREKGFPCSRYPIQLDYGYVSSVDELRYYDANGDLQTLSDPYTIFQLNNKHVPALLELLPGQYWPSSQSDRSYPIDIEYTVGYGDAADVPFEIKHAIKLMVGHWYSNRENVIASPGLTALALPQGAEDLLWPHRDYRF